MQRSDKFLYGAIGVVAVGFIAGGSAFAARHIDFSSHPKAALAAPPRGPLAGQDDGFRFRRGAAGGLQAAATYLGIPVSQLFTDLASGKSLADVAKATDGKTVQGLIDAMVAAEKQQLDAAVSSGMLTQAQADRIESSLEARVTAMVNGTFPGRRGYGPPWFRNGTPLGSPL